MNISSNPPTPPPIPANHLKQASLSYSQESLWFLQQLDPESSAYNSSYLFKLTGGIDRGFFERALNEMVNRHEPLRTVYPHPGGKPIQVIQAFEPISLTCMDFSDLSEDELEPKVHGYVYEHVNQPFNLQRGPLVRFGLLHVAQKVDYLFFCTHHINFDAWSKQIFVKELLQFYDAFRSGIEPDLPELPIQYADYAAWQRDWLNGATLTSYVEHWKSILSGDLPVLELPTDRPRPAFQTFRGHRHHFRLPTEISVRMKDFCQRHRMTPFQILLAAYALLLMRHSGQEEIIIGCPFANRARSELEAIVGLFVNTLPIRVNLQGNPTVSEFLGGIRLLMLEAYPWQAAPFEALVSEISPQRDLSRTPVFQAVINFRNVPQHRASVEGLEIESILQENAPNQFDISLDFDVTEGGELEASFQYNVSLFNESSIVELVAHYKNLLEGLLTKSNHPISELEMLTPFERQKLVFDWNETKVEFPQVCIHELISGQAEKDPEATAVICNEVTLTYGDLERKTNQLAHFLRANGVRAEQRVGVYLPRSERLVIALVAILKAGGAYVPLDLVFPADRIAYMIEDSQPAAIITLSHLDRQLPEHIRKICLDSDSNKIDACDQEKPDPLVNNDSPAYVMYTSGSTGRPKGAVNLNKGIVNFTSHMTRHFHFLSADRVVQFTSISFDGSVWSILGTLTYGGSVILMDDNQMRSPDFIHAAIIKHQATHIDLVPTMLRAICESALAGEAKKHNLRLITVGGEVSLVTDVDLVRRAFGESVILNNEYGPTECSISSIHYLIPKVLPKGAQGVPIGKPIDNSRAYILDKYFHPVPPGVKGEVFIGGIAVGGGYWNRADLSAERFLPDPFLPGERMYRTGDVAWQLPDGTFCFIGRSDNQVKIRGYRVELGEIEAVVNQFPGIKEAAVVLWRNEGSGILAAYITVLEGYKEQIKDKLNAYLVEHLPFYMLPSSIKILDEMPLTPSRKIDRRSLPSPETGNEKTQPFEPRDDREKQLVSIWKEVLEIDSVGVRDNFFELGGHSLLAARMFSRIEKEFGQSIPLVMIFQDGTIESIARALGSDIKQASPIDQDEE